MHIRNLKYLLLSCTLLLSGCGLSAKRSVSESGQSSDNEVVSYNHYQLLKQGYFVVDPDTTSDHLVLNRTCSLKDNYLK